MASKKLSMAVTVGAAMLSLSLAASSAPAAALQEKAIYNFTGSNAAGRPAGNLARDAAGSLYGATCGGGANQFGMVYELSPSGAGGAWKETTLYSFNPINGIDGSCPISQVLLDHAGNVYGTTNLGGEHGVGVVFELTPGAGGTWTETLLHSFNADGTDGYGPQAGLISDAMGNLYGTTAYGGPGTAGTVFKLAPQAGGGWTETVLHGFTPNYKTRGFGSDGSDPIAGLVLDSAGNLYGTTWAGGAYNAGTVFELSAAGGGTWTENIIHSFSPYGTDGYGAAAALIIDGVGNLFGTTNYGGHHGNGVAFELSPQAGGNWAETILHNFENAVGDGYVPQGGLLLGPAGNLYGTTFYGGAYGHGTVFELTPRSGGSWVETIIYSFDNIGADGNSPAAGLTAGPAGNLYGTTWAGGANGLGTVFVITPQP